MTTTTNSTVSETTTASSKAKKGFLVYHFPNFNIVLARAFAVIGVSC